MPSIKWRYLPLSSFHLSRSGAPVLTEDSSGKHIIILIVVADGLNCNDYGTMILALEDD